MLEGGVSYRRGGRLEAAPTNRWQSTETIGGHPVSEDLPSRADGAGETVTGNPESVRPIGQNDGVPSPAPPPPPPPTPKPPPPSDSPVARTTSNTDFATAAAMAKDILEMEPADDTEDQDPAKPASEVEAPSDHEPEAHASAPDTPLAPDFFTPPRPKKRFWRSR